MPSTDYGVWYPDATEPLPFEASFAKMAASIDGAIDQAIDEAALNAPGKYTMFPSSVYGTGWAKSSSSALLAPGYYKLASGLIQMVGAMSAAAAPTGDTVTVLKDGALSANVRPAHRHDYPVVLFLANEAYAPRILMLTAAGGLQLHQFTAVGQAVTELPLTGVLWTPGI